MLTFREQFLLYFVHALTCMVESAKREANLERPQCNDFGQLTRVNVGVRGRWGKQKAVMVRFRLRLQLAPVKALNHILTIQWEGDASLEDLIRTVVATRFNEAVGTIEREFPNQLKVELRFPEPTLEVEQ